MRQEIYENEICDLILELLKQYQSGKSHLDTTNIQKSLKLEYAETQTNLDFLVKKEYVLRLSLGNYIITKEGINFINKEGFKSMIKSDLTENEKLHKILEIVCEDKTTILDTRQIASKFAPPITISECNILCKKLGKNNDIKFCEQDDFNALNNTFSIIATLESADAFTTKKYLTETEKSSQDAWGFKIDKPSIHIREYVANKIHNENYIEENNGNVNQGLSSLEESPITQSVTNTPGKKHDASKTSWYKQAIFKKFLIPVAVGLAIVFIVWLIKHFSHL